MTYSIQQLTDKGSRELNEDEMLVRDNIFVVFDGVTSITKFITKDGKTGGRVAAEIAKQAFAENEQSPKESCTEGNRRLKDAMQQEGIDVHKKGELWGTTVAGVKLYEKEVEVFGIGDSSVLFIDEKDSYSFPYEVEDHDQAMLEFWKKMAEKKVEDIREKVNPMIVKMREKANIKYGVLNGEEAALQLFRSKRMPLKDIKTILIFTDGFMIPSEDPKSPHDWNLFVQLFLESGLSGLLAYVRGLEKEDPFCWKYPRYKQYDDATAIAINFSSEQII